MATPHQLDAAAIMRLIMSQWEHNAALQERHHTAAQEEADRQTRLAMDAERLKYEQEQRQYQQDAERWRMGESLYSNQLTTLQHTIDMARRGNKEAQEALKNYVDMQEKLLPKSDGGMNPAQVANEQRRWALVQAELQKAGYTASNLTPEAFAATLKGINLEKEMAQDPALWQYAQEYVKNPSADIAKEIESRGMSGAGERAALLSDIQAMAKSGQLQDPTHVAAVIDRLEKQYAELAGDPLGNIQKYIAGMGGGHSLHGGTTEAPPARDVIGLITGEQAPVTVPHGSVAGTITDSSGQVYAIPTAGTSADTEKAFDRLNFSPNHHMFVKSSAETGIPLEQYQAAHQPTQAPFWNEWWAAHPPTAESNPWPTWKDLIHKAQGMSGHATGHATGRLTSTEEDIPSVVDPAQHVLHTAVADSHAIGPRSGEIAESLAAMTPEQRDGFHHYMEMRTGTPQHYFKAAFDKLLSPGVQEGGREEAPPTEATA